jgi:hypothetical protein
VDTGAESTTKLFCCGIWPRCWNDSFDRGTRGLDKRLIIRIMSCFYIEFKNKEETLTLKFEAYTHSTAKKWYQELINQLQRNSNIKENNRLYHFPNETWSLENIILELKKRADIINQYKFYIPEAGNIDISINQNLLNILHKYFEEMRGGILNPGEYYVTAPQEIKQAIEDYNVLIHRTENKLNTVRPRIVLTFCDKFRNALTDDDYDNFSLDVKFGEVYVNYCEVGKPLWDVFKDNDHIVGEQNIRPLNWYSADMLIYFTDGSYRRRIAEFWRWWDNNATVLSKLGFVKHDKKLAIGHIPVAKLITDMDKDKVINKIAKFDEIHRVYISN